MLTRIGTAVALTLALVSAQPAPPAMAQETSQTEADRGFVTRFLEDNLSGAGRRIVLTGFEGALSSRATFDTLTIADDDGVWITLRNGAIQWNRSALLARRVDIEELAAEVIELPRLPSAGEDSPTPEARAFELPSLPVSVKIANLSADRVMLGEDVIGEAAEISVNGAMVLSGGEGEARLAIKRRDGKEGDFQLNAGFSNRTRMLQTDLTLDEAADGLLANMIGLHGRPALHATIKGEGPLSDFTADIALATDGNPRIEGRVGITSQSGDDGHPAGTDFRVRLGGDVAALLPEDRRAFFGEQSQLLIEGARAADGALTVPVMLIDTDALNLSGSFALNDRGAPEFATLLMTLGEDAGAAHLPVQLPFGDGTSLVDSGRVELSYDRKNGDGWTLRGNLDNFAQPDLSVAVLDLDGDGRVVLHDDKLAGVNGRIGFDAEGIAPKDPAMAQAIGSEVKGGLNFDWLPENALELADLSIAGADYGLSGDVLVGGLSGGVTATGELRAEYTDLARLSGVAGRPVSGAAEAELSGHITLLTRGFDFEARIAGQDITIDQKQVDNLLAGEASITASARRDEEGIKVADLTINSQRLTGHAEGTISSDDADMSAQIRLASLASIDPEMGGALMANARITGGADARELVVNGEAVDLKTGIDQLDRALHGTTRLQADARQKDDALIIKELHLVNDQLSVAAKGAYAPKATDITATASLPSLGVMGAGYGGALNLDASLRQGADGVRVIALDGTGHDLSLGAGAADSALKGQTDLTVRAKEAGGLITIDTAEITNPRLAATATGHIGDGRTDLNGRLHADSLAFLGRGIRGALTVEGGLIDDGNSQTLKASGQAVNLGVGVTQADALLGGTTQLELDASRSADQIEVRRLEISNPQLNVSAAGNLDSAIRVNARLANLGLIQREFPGSASVEGSLRRAGTQIGVDMTASGPGGTRAQVAGQVQQDFSTMDLRITGTSEAAVANPFLRVRSIEGPVSFDLAVRGKPALEALSGRVSLSGARLSDPGLGMRVDGLRADAQFDNGRINVDGAGNMAAGGRVAVNGSIAVTGARPIDMTVDLDGVVLRDPNLYTTHADGQVRVSGALASGPLIAGTIHLSQTELRIPSTGLGGAKDIPDIVHLHDRPPVRATRAKAGLLPWPSEASQDAGMSGPAATPPQVPAQLDLTISAPTQIFIRGRGVDAEMGGQLRLTGRVNNVVPIGMFELIRGRVDLLGKRFDLTEGLLELQGSMIPIIRLVAQTEQNSIVTRVTIDGDARDPEITFSAIPDMPQEEVLSQLLFGRGLDTITPLQAAQLANAVAVLAGRGGAGIVGKLRESVGLDDLDLATDDEGNVTVRAGKYLSENVYTDVAVGADGTSTIQLNLDITPEVTARGSVDSDGTSALGIFYERDF